MYEVKLCNMQYDAHFYGSQCMFQNMSRCAKYTHVLLSSSVDDGPSEQSVTAASQQLPATSANKLSRAR